MSCRFSGILLILLLVTMSRAGGTPAIPVANFTANNTSICEAQCISFTDLSTNNPTSWSWTFQGASITSSTQQHPSNICYYTAGTYFVSLTVSNASGSNTLYLAGYITVYPSSVVNLLANGDFNNYNTAFTTQLTYLATGTLSPDQYSIDTNAYYHNSNWAAISPDTTPFFMCDGSLTAGRIVWSASPSQVFPASAYTFSFLMTNLDVNHSFIQPELLTTVTDQGGIVLFSGTTGLLPAANSNVPPVYVWTPFSYVFNTLANTTSITITLSQVGGTYLGFDFGLEDLSLKTHFCDSLAVLPVAAMFTDENIVCPGTCVSFQNQSVNANSVLWSFPGANPSVSTDFDPQNICYNNPGSYDVTIIANNSSGSDTLTIPGFITVLPYPQPQGITQSGDTLIANQGAISYQWYHNGIFIPGATDYFYIASGSGNYNVVATDLNGCQVEAAIFDVVAGITFGDTGGEVFSLSPNPVTDLLKIEFSEMHDEHPVVFSVYDVCGKKMREETSAGRSLLVLDCSAFSPGVYFLGISTCAGLKNIEFFKQ